LGRDAMDGTVPFYEADDAVGPDDGLGEVALLVLNDGELAGTIEDRRPVRWALGHPLSNSFSRHPTPFVEDVVDEPVPTDGADPGQGAVREAIVVRGEQVLGRLGHVVEVSRSPDSMPLSLSTDQSGRLQRTELLEDACAA